MSETELSGIPKRIRVRFRNLRIQHGAEAGEVISQAKLAQLVSKVLGYSVSQTNISKIELGQNISLNMEIVCAVCQIFNISDPSEIFEFVVD
jgi:hypothetical protein